MNDFEDKCFIISEIGEANSIERRRADKFKAIIEAALAKLTMPDGRQIASLRLDGDRSVDNFLDEIIKCILTHRLVVAVLSNRNPNAHLELGLALAAGRPVTILIEKHTQSQAPTARSFGPWPWPRSAKRQPGLSAPVARFADLPSDLRGYSCIECALPDDVGSPPDAQAVQALADKLQEQINKGEQPLAFNRYVPFGKHGPVRYMNRFSELSFHQWSRILWDADRQISIATTSMKYLLEPTRLWFFSRKETRRAEPPEQAKGTWHLLDILIAKAAFEGVRVRIMMMDPDNPFLDHLVHSLEPRSHADALRNVRDEIGQNARHMKAYLDRLITPSTTVDVQSFLDREYPDLSFPVSDGGSLEIVSMKRGSLFARTTLTDQVALITPYHLVEDTNSGPCLLVRNESITVMDRGGGRKTDINEIYAQTKKNLDELYALNTAHTQSYAGPALRPLALG